ncbi:MAG: hypothetical protein V3T83_06200 [Acidobacteriota bacterium]
MKERDNVHSDPGDLGIQPEIGFSPQKLAQGKVPGRAEVKPLDDQSLLLSSI